MAIEEPPFSHQDREILGRERLHSGFLNVNRYTVKHRLYLGGWSGEFTREVLERDPGAGVLLYDADLDKVVLVEQFRAGCLDNVDGPWVLELVAGIIDTDESPSVVVTREAREEAGLDVSHLIPICSYYNSPGGSSELLHVFCGKVDSELAQGVHGLAEENEDIKTIVLSREDAIAGLASGRINNAMAIVALQWLALHLDEVKAHFAQPEKTAGRRIE